MSATSDPLVPATAATELVVELRSQKLTVATCESLTAGLLSATIAGVPGASAVLRGGIITYATEMKHQLADVSVQLLHDYGPVSRQCAAAMADGARQRCDADFGVSLTGVAGPTEQDGHPVGEVWCGLSRAEGTVVKRLQLSPESGRWGIRSEAVTRAIELLLEEICRVGNKTHGPVVSDSDE
ncbi:CinA family protein [Corynebacterium sp. H78]|uniref:CinA family protein n=1 Tax=Corynebacterium sp. H78 TaxID=3133417 RepID=UPI0030AB7792